MKSINIPALIFPSKNWRADVLPSVQFCRFQVGFKSLHGRPLKINFCTKDKSMRPIGLNSTSDGQGESDNLK